MSSSTHPIIVPSDYDVEDAFSSTNFLLPIFSYRTIPSSSETPLHILQHDLLSNLLASLAISPFHDDPYMKAMQVYDATSNELPIPLPQAPIAPPTVLPPFSVLPLSPMFDPQYFFSLRVSATLVSSRFLSSSLLILLLCLKHLRLRARKSSENNPRITQEREVVCQVLQQLRNWESLQNYIQKYVKSLDLPATTEILSKISKIAKSLAVITRKTEYIWGEDQVSAFHLLKRNICEAPILAYQKETDDFRLL
ncbi:hypothetical protein Tco_0241644 [Tanacetum coccineum]